MTAPAAVTDTTQTAADAAVAASTTQTDTTGQTPEQIAAAEQARAGAWVPPANKEAYDKAISEAVEAAKPKVPDKYDGLKLPDKITVDPTLVERTGAIARDLGLSQDKAQKALDFVASEAARETAAALASYSAPSAEMPEGGAKWKEQNDAWRAASLTDKELGNGKPEQLVASAELAKKVLAKFGDPESIDFVDSVLGSNPAALRILVRIGRAMGEQGLVRAQGTAPEAPKAVKDIMYPHGADLVEGDPRLNQPAAT